MKAEGKERKEESRKTQREKRRTTLAHLQVHNFTLKLPLEFYELLSS
jgi:hypothetical protein